MYEIDKRSFPPDKQVRNYLKGIDPDRKIKVGCDHGTAYFFFGTAREFLEGFDEINQKIIKEATDRIANYIYDKLHTMEKSNLRRERIMQIAENIFEYLRNYKPIEERGVIEHTLSIYDGEVDRIIISGYEQGKHWTYDEYLGIEKPLNPQNVTNEKAIDLVSAVHKMAADDLTIVMRREHHKNVDSQSKLEKFFRQDPYGLLQNIDPESIIKECYRQSKLNKPYDGRARNGKPKAKTNDVKAGAKTEKSDS